MASITYRTATHGAAPATATGTAPAGRRVRREAATGPRCAQCAGPLVFGEGCSMCPVCGYSSCGV